MKLNTADECPSCTDGILNGEEFTTDCGGPDCPDCDCEITELAIEGSNPREVCTTTSAVNFTATAGLYDYEWSVSPGYPTATVNSNTHTASVALNNPYNYQYFTVTVTARDCNGDQLIANSAIITLPCGGGWMSEPGGPAITDRANEIYISPNPGSAKQQFDLKGIDPELEMIQYTISDLTGKLIQEGIFTNGNRSFHFESQVPNGVYFIRLTDQSQQVVVKRVLIQD